MNTESSQIYCGRCLTTFGENPDRCPNLVCKRFRPEEGWGRLYQVGQVIDRNYRVLQMLAMGGAGVTYRAREVDEAGELSGPDLALKVLFQSRSGGSYLRRLATEAQIIQELDHPNIVRYHGFVHRSGHAPYLITGYESGGSLLAHLERIGSLSVQRTVAIGRQICAALEKGHQYGVVHRDLKPENILLHAVVGKDEDPEVRVADFGIAKVQAGLGSNLTRAGAFVGTPHYAAPEQFQGRQIGDSADVYGCGAMLYFCMTLQHIVKFADRLDPLDSYDLLRENLPPVVERPNDDPQDVARINQVLAVAMHPDPDLRCDIQQFGEMLKSVQDRADPVIPTPKLRVSGSFTTDLRDDGPPRIASAAFTLEKQPAPPEDKAVLGFGLAALMGALLLLVVVVVGGAGFIVWKSSTSEGGAGSDTDAVGPHDPSIPTISAESTDPDAKADYTAILRSSRMVSTRLKRQCKVTMPEQVGLELVLEANGSVRSAEVVKSSSQATTACVVGQVGGHRFKRKGDGPVRIRLDLTIR